MHTDEKKQYKPNKHDLEMQARKKAADQRREDEIAQAKLVGAFERYNALMRRGKGHKP